MALGLKIAGALCLVLDLACIVALVSYGFKLLQSGAEVANEATGQVVAIHNKTHILYVTQAQINALYGIVVLNIGLTITAIILLSLARRGR